MRAITIAERGTEMLFESRYYGERLKIINPHGDVGVVTLWSKVDSAVGILGESGVSLSPERSRISVVANLYGNGLPHMLRNLLWNPQIRHILVFGKNLSGSAEHFINFFKEGLEEVEFLGGKAFRIKNTNRIIDGLVTPEQFAHLNNFGAFGDLTAKETKDNIRGFFDALPHQSESDIERIEPPPIPEPTVTRFPSEPGGHTIICAKPIDGWEEIIFRLYRFGYHNRVGKKGGTERRIELQNMKVVIRNPSEESPERLGQYGFNLDHFHEYQKRILDPNKPSDLDYTYGNLMRGYSSHYESGEKVDSLQVVVDRLNEEPESRHEYISLWDNSKHLPRGRGCPCFVSAFFRKFDDALTLTASFRTHNAMDAWPENVYGLIAIQRYVAERVGMKIGSLSVISHSISIDPSSLEKAKKIAENKKTDDEMDSVTGKYVPRFDPNGDFIVTVDSSRWEIVVQHTFGGMPLAEYRGKRAEDIEAQLARDGALSVISHALYLGRTIARAEAQMIADRFRTR
ncbi:MAG: hypothetical protein QG589_603 [Patescibacteria group bacterium]|nr:hypothetical protein [Patescibacteria group bacterium]